MGGRNESNMDYKKRRVTLANDLQANSLLVVHAGNQKHRSQDSYYSFDVSRNFYYLTGITQAGVIVALHKTSTGTESYLFIEEFDEVKAKWDGAMLTKQQASQLSGIDEKNIYFLSAFSSFVQNRTVVSRAGIAPISSVYLDLYRLKGVENKEAHDYASFLQETYPEITIENANALFAKHRALKSADEVDAIRRAITVTKTALESVWSFAKPGMNEADLDAKYQYEVLKQTSSEAFDSIVAGGGNATVLHYVENNQPIKANDLVLTDIGSTYELYNSDITRTWPISGKFSARQQELYELVLSVNKECINMVKPGVTWEELNQFARQALATGLVKLGVMKDESDVGKYYYHSIGHHLGLDVHDSSLYHVPLEAGNVITIEPGIYIAEEQIGIRVEDDVLVTTSGCENLSKAIVKEIKEIEAALSK
jgi:Xaa-Pro aminopeptidase